MKKTVELELPESLLNAAHRHVEEGWAGGLNELMADALRRYLESHASDIAERFIREDVDWALNGND